MDARRVWRRIWLGLAVLAVAYWLVSFIPKGRLKRANELSKKECDLKDGAYQPPTENWLEARRLARSARWFPGHGDDARSTLSRTLHECTVAYIAECWHVKRLLETRWLESHKGESAVDVPWRSVLRPEERAALCPGPWKLYLDETGDSAALMKGCPICE
jgi:hypothetical protein